MYSKQAIKHRAVILAITTGAMPNVDLIWRIQHFEGHEECFGQGNGCRKLACRWCQGCREISAVQINDVKDKVKVPGKRRVI